MTAIKNNLIVYGYIRLVIEEPNSIYIPNEIKVISIKYLDNYFSYQRQYKWVIKGKLLQKILIAYNQQLFQSPEFSTPYTKWKITVFPNGANKNQIGMFCLYLHRIKEVKEYDEIISRWRVTCNQLKTSCTNIGETSQWIPGCLLLNEIKNSGLNTITITVQIQILKIMDNIKTVIYRHATYYHTPFKKQSFSWDIDGNLMMMMKQSYSGKRFECDIYNKMWCLSIAPNGANKRWNDAVDIFLILCSLPVNVSKIYVKWKIKCEILDIERTGDKFFSLENGKYFECWSKDKVLSFQKFKKYDRIIIDVEVEIADLYDDEEYTITNDREWNDCIYIN